VSDGVYVPEIVDGVVELGVKVIVHVPAAPNVQLAGVTPKVPAPPLEVKLTEPAGVVTPGAPLVSETVTVQVEG
jgi:hypothetical protein